MKKLYILVCFLFSFSFTTIASQTDTTLSTFVNVHQGNGAGLATRTVVDTFFLPHDISGYSSINMHVQLNCPTGGCDPWDRFASVKVWHDTDWYEIGRYMTPYGKSCGWNIDVSDYRSMLSDTVIINSFIDTWTNPGWLVNIDFTFTAGIPVNPYIHVENLWNNENVIYGDSTQPINLPMLTRNIDGSATTVKIKMVNTGHGQGNTDNAAEFSQKTHHIVVNGIHTYNQLLWRSNCNSNPCSPQSGTWQYNRAGWCPGADVLPNEYDITSNVTPGQNVNIQYQLQSYFNNCSPNNSGCVTGSTCTDCNYNYNGHTEPHYKIASQIISYLSTPTGITGISKKVFSISPNPSSGIFNIHVYQSGLSGIFEVISPSGKIVYSGKITGVDHQIDLNNLQKGFYLIKLQSEKQISTQKLIIN